MTYHKQGNELIEDGKQDCFCSVDVECFDLSGYSVDFESVKQGARLTAYKKWLNEQNRTEQHYHYRLTG
jgi:hypothetical protein